MPSFKPVSILVYFGCLFFLLPAFSLRAGLIIETSDAINISSIKSLHISEEQLIVYYGSNRKKIITLPDGGMDNVLLWVKRPCSGPFVISVDGALVPGASTYTSPCLPPGLADVLIYYDVYAHTFAQGDIPRDTMLHPLISKTGNMSSMPHAQYARLMNPQNRTPQALWYRNLMSRFPNNPGVIGEFTIKAVATKKGFPIGIETVSHRWFRPSLWYRKVTAASEFDNTAFDLPYAPLKGDIETRFDEYRKKFKPFDELASIVEAYALLKKIYHEKPALWNSLLKEKCGTNTMKCILAGTINRGREPSGSWYDTWNAEISWADWSKGGIGGAVETSQEADLALCHLWSGVSDTDLDFDKFVEWEEGIEVFAEKNPDIQAKYLLYQFKNKTEDEEMRKVLATDFLELTRNSRELMRLRIIGSQKMLEIEDAEWLTELVEAERKKISQDFVASIEALKTTHKESNDDFLMWEDLSQTVYSTGLLSFLQSNNGYRRNSYDPNFARALAYVHYRRGLAFQRGQEFAYQHAHFRYLRYLSENTSDTKVRQIIHVYRSKLAKHMGIMGWDEQEFFDVFDMGWQESSLSDDDEGLVLEDPSFEPWRKQTPIEGELLGAASFFSDNSKNSQLPQDGGPVGILSPDGSFRVLLLDSRIFLTSKTTRKSPVRVYGISYPDIKAITPIILEIKGKSGEWEPLDIPHSGTSVSGIFNGQ